VVHIIGGGNSGAPGTTALRASASPGRTFSALRNRNFRRYFAAQVVSLVGTWMETIAQSWLVLQLTHSGTALGLVVAAQFLPVLLLSPYAGVIVDRIDKRKILFATQSVMAACALALGLLCITHEVRLWMVFLIAFSTGVASAFDGPNRQAFVMDIVGPDEIRNAVTMNSISINVARAAGSAVAGVVIAAIGVSWCFLANAISFAAVIGAVATFDLASLHPAERTARGKGQVRSGFAYVLRTPTLLMPIVMMVLVGTLTYEFPVTLALLAKDTFHGGASTYGFLTTALGTGAVLGGVWVAARGGHGLRPLAAATATLGAGLLVTTFAPSVHVAVAALFVAGVGMIAFNSIGNTTLQLEVDPLMRGRVMALWSVAFVGSTPLGGPITGAIGQHFGARWSVAVGAIAALAASALAVVTLMTRRRRGRRGREGQLGPGLDAETTHRDVGHKPGDVSDPLPIGGVPHMSGAEKTLDVLAPAETATDP
jgi:MFS family permease